MYTWYINKRGFHMDEVFNSWLDEGMKQGWITEPFCHTHDGDPYMTEEEEKEWEDGGDPCMFVVKLLNN